MRRRIEKTFADLEACRRLLLAHGMPGVRIVITVSPVPLSRTFLGDDVLTANGYSKGMLRGAAGEFADAHDDVEYFGSYEMITVSERSLAYLEDQVHVQNSATAAVTSAFLSRFGLEAEAAPPAFSEHVYLRLNPDIDAAVGRREFASGYEHWERHGRSEGRPIA